MALDEDDLMGLSDEERAALEEDTGDETGGDEPDDEGVAEAAVPADDEPPADPPPAVEAGDEVTDEPAAAAPAEDPQFRPQYRPEVPEDIDAKLAELTEKKKALRDEYQSGDLEFADYEDQREAIAREERALENTKFIQQVEQERQAQTLAQQWTWEQDRYFEDAKHRVFRDNAVLREGFNAVLRELSADDANSAKSMRWFLEEAGKLTEQRAREALGMGAPAAPAAPAPRAAAPRAPIPPNLGDMPAADIESPAKDEWAHLDRLPPDRLEAALERMPAAELARYRDAH